MRCMSTLSLTHRLSNLLLATLCTLLAQPAAAQADTERALTQRPKVALVLSGGGARGFAHVGVLRVLQELRVPVDMVIGTSMGAVVGGAYAAGRSVQELEDFTRNTAWDNLLSDRPARDALEFRRKEDDTLVRSRIEFLVDRNGVSLPASLAGNSTLESALSRLLPGSLRDATGQQLPLPFRSVASDLLTGDMVELHDVPLFLALRASLSVPGVFSPVRVHQRLLVDGGLVRNLPVDLARAMGADVIIAVNVGTPLATERELGSALSVANQMLQILTEQNVQRSLRELRSSDVLIAPDLSAVSFLDFGQHQQAIAAGAAAARQMTAALTRLSVSAEHYAAYEHQRRERAVVTVDSTAPGQIRLDPTPAVAVTEPGAAPVADVPSTPSSRKSQGLRLGFEVESDFSQVNRFALKALHTIPALNAAGAELRSTVQVGATQALTVELWQPLFQRSPWYVSGALGLGSGTTDVFDRGRKTARLGLRGGVAALSLGRQFGEWGDLRLGASRITYRATPQIPEDPLNRSVRQFDSTQFVQYRIDTLDALEFPTRGQLLTLRWERDVTAPGTSGLAISSTATGLAALQVGPWAGHLYGEWSRAQAGSAPLSLGGFLRLSGTPPVSVEGQTVVLGRWVLARRVGQMPGPLGNGPVRAGFSLEMGAGFQPGQTENFHSLKQAGSAFLSIDTRLGHLYLGAGTTRGTGSSLYLFFGPTW